MQLARSDGFDSIPSATGGVARLACARLGAMGKDPSVLLSKVGLTHEMVGDPTIRLEVRTEIKLLKLAAEEVQDEWLGFHLARSFDLREIGLVYYVMASSEQLADALRNAERYSQINNEGVRLRFRTQDGSAVIALNYVNVDRDTDRHQTEFWLVTLVRICRQLTNGRLLPSRLKTRHFRNRMPAEFRTFFGVDIEFGANADEIWFPPPIASLSVAGTRRISQRTVVALRGSRRWRTSPTAPHGPFQGRGRSHETAAARRKQFIGSKAAAWNQHANFVAQSCRRGYFPAEILDELRAALAKRYLHDEDVACFRNRMAAWLSRGQLAGTCAKMWTGMTPDGFVLVNSRRLKEPYVLPLQATSSGFSCF